MQRKPIAGSSNIRSIGFEDGTLEIEFRSGAVYRYEGVPEQVYLDLVASESVGQFFAEFIKGRYPFTKA